MRLKFVKFWSIFSIIIIILTLFIANNTNAKQQDHSLERISNDYVVILHGIARSSSHMEGIEEYLKENNFSVVNIDYPSTDHKIEKLVDIVQAKIVKNTPEEKKIHFVGYSMGCLITRAVINKYRPKKLGKVIFIAPPNKGSEVADFLENNWLYKKIYGPAGNQLTTKNLNSKEFIDKVFGKIDYDLGVIAGNFTIDPISSTIIPGDDDGKVSVESTIIDGMKDHIVISASHTFFPSNNETKEQVLYFLQNNKFNK